MASITRLSGGRKMIQFTDGDGKRRTIRLGKTTVKAAENVKIRVETLQAAKTSGNPIDNDTAKWTRSLPNELANKLAAAGLVAARDTTTVDGLLKAFMAANSSEAKPSTRAVWRTVGRDLRLHFGEDYPIRTIGRVEAEVFRQGLIERKLAATTIHKRLQFTRRFFSHAVRFEWIERNPFADIKHKSGDPQLRQHYISVEETERLIDAAPNYVWRTIIALARYGGLRSPSEVLSLPLDNLDWERGAVKVVSPKTEGHGQSTRTIPMFALLRPHLLEAAEMAEVGQTHVIPEHLYLPAAQGPNGWRNSNLRTTFKKIVLRAGLEPWPRLFHNLRASCESDLAREYPITTVCRWLGNTVSIAVRHYIQVTDADFQRAAQGGEDPKTKALQNAQQYTPETVGKSKKTPVVGGGQGDLGNSHNAGPHKDLRKTTELYRKSFRGNELRKAEGMGLEPTTSFPAPHFQ